MSTESTNVDLCLQALVTEYATNVSLAEMQEKLAQRPVRTFFLTLERLGVHLQPSDIDTFMREATETWKGFSIRYPHIVFRAEFERFFQR